jgi:nucleoside-diphosphate-sugar epimerase
MKRVFVTGASGFVGGRVVRTLRETGIEVVALARSDRAAKVIAELDAQVARGDLDDVAAMTAGMKDCDTVIHAAAHTAEHGALAPFLRVTVEGTSNAIAAARAAGVRRFVHVSSEAVLADGHPIVRADETRPRPPNPAGPYPLSKALAEERVLAACAEGFDAVIVRPRFVWGEGDTSLLPKILEVARKGKFAWIGGGHYLTSTTHVDNAVEGFLCAAEKGKRGEIYFVTDGEPVDFRDFMTELLRAYGVDAGDRTVPRWLAGVVAATTSWMKNPPLTKTALALIGHEVTVVDAKARRDLGYVGAVSRADGIAEIRALETAPSA